MGLVCKPVLFLLFLLGSRDKLEVSTTDDDPAGVSSWNDSVSPHCIVVGDVSRGFPQQCSSRGATSIGVSCLDSSDLFLQPRAQLQQSTSMCLPHLDDIRDVLVLPLVPHIKLTQASMAPGVLKFLQLGLRLRCFPK